MNVNSIGAHLHSASPRARAAHSIIDPNSGNLYENFDIDPHLCIKVPISLIKIGPKYLRLPNSLILGLLCPNFECVSPQNT